MASYGKVLGDSLKFGFSPKRWLPFFVLDSVFLFSFLAIALANFGELMNLMMTLATSPMAGMSLAGYALLLIAGFIVWFLLRLWITGAVVHQAANPKEFGKSWKVSRQRFLSLLAVTIIVGVISAIVSMVPFIGWIFAIVVGLIFFLVVPSVVVKKMPFDRSMVDSYNIFRKRPLSVFLMWLAIAIVSLIIMMVFFLPTLAAVWGYTAPFIGQVESSNIVALAVISMLNNIWVLVLCGIVVLLGMAVTTAFSLKAQTEFYLQMKAKKFGVF